jgi:hypothetical protein
MGIGGGGFARGAVECSWSYPVLRIGWIHIRESGYTEWTEVCWRRTKAPRRPSWDRYVLRAERTLTGIKVAGGGKIDARFMGRFCVFSPEIETFTWWKSLVFWWVCGGLKT